MTDYVSVQLVLGLGPVRTMGAGKRTVAVSSNVVTLQLCQSTETLGAKRTFFSQVFSRMHLFSVQHHVVACWAFLHALLATEATLQILWSWRMQLTRMSLQAGLCVVGSIAHFAHVVLLP
jgi:hypothetical protein